MNRDKIPYEHESKKRALFPEIFFDAPIDPSVDMMDKDHPLEDGRSETTDTTEYRI